MISLFLYSFCKAPGSFLSWQSFFMYLSSSTHLNKSEPKKKEKKKKVCVGGAKMVFINRIIRACFRAGEIQRDIKAELTNSNLIIVKYSGNSISLAKILKDIELILIFKLADFHGGSCAPRVKENLLEAAEVIASYTALYLNIYEILYII